MTRRSLVVPAGIVIATAVAAVVVLVAGGPDRGGLAMVLLVAVPLLLAMGAGSDQGWQATSRSEGPSSAGHLGIRLVSLLPVVLVEVAVVVLLVRQVVMSVAGGDVVSAVALVPFAMLFGWRGWQFSRRLGAGR